jgi:hypothetical protein
MEEEGGGAEIRVLREWIYTKVSRPPYSTVCKTMLINTLVCDKIYEKGRKKYARN